MKMSDRLSKRLIIAFSVFAMFTLWSLIAKADKPDRFIRIDYPGAVHTFVFGINPRGNIVGAYDDALGREHGFVLQKGEFTTIDYPGATWTDAYGINPRGDVVGQYGWSENGTNTTHGFLWRDGDFTSIDVPGEQNTMPFKINPEGVIVGCNHHNVNATGGTDLNTMKGFMIDKSGAVSQFLIRSMNTGVNPEGDSVGYYFGTPAGTPSSRAEWSYLNRDGVTTWFQFPGAFATLATDINPSGAIIGAYRATSATPAVFHGFIVDDDGEFESFDAPGASNTRPYGINARGDVVGYYVAAGVSHGFLLRRHGSE